MLYKDAASTIGALNCDEIIMKIIAVTIKPNYIAMFPSLKIHWKLS